MNHTFAELGATLTRSVRPDQEPTPPPRYVGAVEQVVIDTIRNPGGRLLLLLPPRHGASTYVTTGALAVVEEAGKRAMLASWSFDNARRMAASLETHLGIYVEPVGLDGTGHVDGTYDTIVFDTPVAIGAQAEHDRVATAMRSLIERVGDTGSVLAIGQRRRGIGNGDVLDQVCGDWPTLAFRAIDTELLWPEEWPAARLAKTRAAVPADAWAAMYLHT